jgi:hypothetical protein
MKKRRKSKGMGPRGLSSTDILRLEFWRVLSYAYEVLKTPVCPCNVNATRCQKYPEYEESLSWK